MVGRDVIGLRLSVMTGNLGLTSRDFKLILRAKTQGENIVNKAYWSIAPSLAWNTLYLAYLTLYAQACACSSVTYI